jgi:hypothetical protein
MQEWSTETVGENAQREVASQLEGRVVAVDISLWVCQATQHTVLMEVFDNEDASAVKVCFDRVMFPANPA